MPFSPHFTAKWPDSGGPVEAVDPVRKEVIEWIVLLVAREVAAHRRQPAGCLSDGHRLVRIYLDPAYE
jgi:hypothetical protein